MSKPTVKAVLTRADELLATEDNWAQGRMHESPTCHCTLGAIYQAYVDLGGMPADEYHSEYDLAEPYAPPVAKCINDKFPGQADPLTAEGFEEGELAKFKVTKFNDARGYNLNEPIRKFSEIKEVLACAIAIAPDEPPAD